MHGLFCAGRQRGVTLLVAMLILVAVVLVGASAARLALQGEQAARAGRDRQVAFQAAEDALMDGERDVARPAVDGDGPVSATADVWNARSALFGFDTAQGFVDGCGTGPVNAGLCARTGGGAAPAWQAVDLSGIEDGGGHTVQFGGYSGAFMQTGTGFLPFRRPRYLIERVPCHQPGDEVGAAGGYCYRVTAIGFGARPETEVVLQSVYRKAE
jgi:type IV pilus assembly protein PilX